MPPLLLVSPRGAHARPSSGSRSRRAASRSRRGHALPCQQLWNTAGRSPATPARSSTRRSPSRSPIGRMRISAGFGDFAIHSQRSAVAARYHQGSAPDRERGMPAPYPLRDTCVGQEGLHWREMRRAKKRSYSQCGVMRLTVSAASSPRSHGPACSFDTGRPPPPD